MPAETPSSVPDPRETKRYYFGDTPSRRLVTLLVKGSLRLFATWEAYGVEHLPDRGPVVLAANHVTNYDVFFMQLVLPRLIFFMGKAELFKNPLLEPLLRNLGGFPVQRGGRDEWAFRQAQKVLAHGQVLGIFPEGKRNHGKGLHPGKTGAARLAILAGCPLVPMAVDGTQLVFKTFPRRAHVKVTLGEPIFPLPYETPLALTDRLMFAIAGMLPPAQRGVYALHPRGF